MKAYTYFFPDADGSIPSFDVTLCESDEAARRRCPEMLQARPGRILVEVFEDDRFVGRYCNAPAGEGGVVSLFPTFVRPADAPESPPASGRRPSQRPNP